MPVLLRKFFPPEGAGTGAAATADAPAPTSAAGLAALCQAVPTALAVVGGGEVQAWNPACRALLQEVVGGSELAARRWLAASVLRLQANNRSCEILAGSSDSLCLEVKLGSELPDSGRRLVALREVANTTGRESDLAETVSTLSHELRTPLTSMKSSLRLVLTGEAGPVNADQQRFLDMTMRNIDRLERLVNDLLDVSRTEAGEMVLHRTETDLGPVLREAAQMQAAGAARAGLEFDWSGLPENFTAHADPDRLIQILTNVLGNSIKYTPKGGLVRVWLEARPQPDPGLSWLLAETFFLPLHSFNIVVEDSGVGMTRADLDRIFEPWFRGREDRDGHTAGAGLGLHITRSLVEAHGGRIRLASEPGRGTTVWIRLPRDPQTETLLQGTRQLRALAAGGGVVAVLDGRRLEAWSDGRLDGLAGSFVQHNDVGDGRKLVNLAPDLVATVVTDPAGWSDAWQRHNSARAAEDAPEWQFLAWEPELQ